MISQEMRCDTLLSKVHDFILNGWSFSVDQNCDYSLITTVAMNSVVHGCMIWGNRVIVPQKLRQSVITKLHSGHLVMVKMKGICQSFAWGP